MSENQNRVFAKYDAMATEELEEILRADSQSPEGQESDGELVLYVMGVLAERKRNSDNPGKTAQQAWESFEEHYLPKEEDTHTAQNNRKTPWFRRWVAAAAVVAILVTIPFTASALSWDEIWNAVASWAKNTFSFTSSPNSTQATEPSPTNIDGYQSLQQALAETDQASDIVPTWIPDGYRLLDITVDENPIQKSYMALYVDGERWLKITVKSHIVTDPEKIEINDELLEMYSLNDTDFYIFSNSEKLRVVWLENSYECSIVGDITIEEIKLMIDSIVKG